MKTVDEIAYQNEFVTIGIFRCAPFDPIFENSGPIQNHIAVFLRTSVQIQHPGREPIITSPNLVMYYNRGQLYRRRKVSEVGDICEWFAFDQKLLLDALSRYDRTAWERQENPFDITHAPSDPDSLLLQRMLFEHLRSQPEPRSDEEGEGIVEGEQGEGDGSRETLTTH